jgi:hypothetical protein
MADIEKGINPTTFSWQPPITNVDGSPVNGPLNYNVYTSDTDTVSKATGVFYVVVGTLQTDGSYTAPLDQFPDGRNVLALTAVDAEGDESGLSNTLGFTITDGVAPRPPVLLPS